MHHGTTTPAPMDNALLRPPHESSVHRYDTGRLSVEVEGQRLRVRPPQCATQWLPDTPSNRHLTLGWLRLLRDAHDRPCFTLQAFAPLVVARAYDIIEPSSA